MHDAHNRGRNIPSPNAVPTRNSQLYGGGLLNARSLMGISLYEQFGCSHQSRLRRWLALYVSSKCDLQSTSLSDHLVTYAPVNKAPLYSLSREPYVTYIPSREYIYQHALQFTVSTSRHTQTKHLVVSVPSKQTRIHKATMDGLERPVREFVTGANAVLDQTIRRRP